MGAKILHAAIWTLVAQQHGVITRAQLLSLGLSDRAIKHRVARGRLFIIYAGVYAVGRRELSREGEWMAAVLACGKGAMLGYGSGAALLKIGHERGRIEVCVPPGRHPDQPQLRVHRRRDLGEWGYCDGIPVMNPADVLVDLATYLDRDPLEAAVNAADRQDLIDPEALRAHLDTQRGRKGVRTLKRLLDIHTFVFTDSTLERMYLPLSDAAGLPRPETQRYIGSYRVDFIYWTLKLVVETNGLRYHRTPASQARDYERSQAHVTRGLTTLPFSHGQIRYEPEHVLNVLTETAAARRHAA